MPSVTLIPISIPSRWLPPSRMRMGGNFPRSASTRVFPTVKRPLLAPLLDQQARPPRPAWRNHLLPVPCLQEQGCSPARRRRTQLSLGRREGHRRPHRHRRDRIGLAERLRCCRNLQPAPGFVGSRAGDPGPASIHATTVPRRLLVVLPDGLAVLKCPGPHLTKDSVGWYTYINAIPGIDPRTGATGRRTPAALRRHRCAQRREWRPDRGSAAAPRQPHVH